MTDSEPRQVDWASARIEDGALIVELTGKGSKAWKARFGIVLELLETPHSTWGEVHLNKNAVEVADVQQGTESELRHFLESIVLQANSDTQPQAPGVTIETDDNGDEPDVDEQMATTFRAFAQQQED